MNKTNRYNSHYEPLDAPWGSHADTEAYECALEVYRQRCAEHSHVVLIKSGHDYTKGYWVEIGIPGLYGFIKFPDIILHVKTKNAIFNLKYKLVCNNSNEVI